jgi:FKBP-type peptidyl-prolyl cis-trans isomerase (trigger factor)
MDIVASCEGKADESLSCRLKWFEMPYFRPESLKAEVLNHKRGDLFETTFIVEDHAGDKEVKAQVKIHELQTITLPDLDDDLAKTAKADSLEILKATEKVKFEEYQINADKSTVVDHVITSMLQKSKVPPAPMSWIDTNAKRIMGEHVTSHGGDNAKAANALGCADEAAMLDAFRSQVNRDYIQDLVMRKYAQIFELGSDLSKIFDHMLSKAEWVEAK